ncbi:uncharacterized protein LOC144350050 [Saccoglossus kowalevskii]
MQKKVRRLAKEEKLMADNGILTSLRYTFPILCCCLAVLGLGKKNCLICEEKEKKDFHHCTKESCDMVYCAQCWNDTDNECYACSPYSYDDDTDSSDWEME